MNGLCVFKVSELDGKVQVKAFCKGMIISDGKTLAAYGKLALIVRCNLLWFGFSLRFFTGSQSLSIPGSSDNRRSIEENATAESMTL